MDRVTKLEPMLRQLQQRLSARGETVATAESCTGGLLAVLLTHLAGSSAIYLGGVSVYANEAKIALLGIEPRLLDTAGAVSADVATAMARAARIRLGSTYAMSLTGVAGPDGGRPEKPVGTVYCGLASPRGARATLLALTAAGPDARSEIRWGAAEVALALLMQEISDCNTGPSE
jgi:PncC family amidohydrolase